MKRLFLIIAINTIISSCVKSKETKPIEEEQQINNLLAKLSIEEKVGQLNLIPIQGEPTEKQLQMIRDGKVGSILKANGVALNTKLQKIAIEESKNGIPILFQEDVIHGYKTIAPIPLAEAASWDIPAIRKSSAVAAREASAAGIQLTYAPMVDISRDPRWGRIIETAGEDVYLGSLVAAARVKGFQESNKKGENILACVKHFVGYGASLAGRDYNIQDFSERELRETHLPPFQAAINANVASLMCAYTAYDGKPLTINSFLLKDVLRDEMGFKGLAMTDWQTIPNLVKIGVSKNDTIAVEASIKSGIDMDMAAQKYLKLIPYLVKTGKVSEEIIDAAVRKVLVLKQKAGLLDNPLKLLDSIREKKELLSERNIAETKEITLKSMVLLKNNKNTLPIKKNVKSIAIIGPFAKANKDMLGWWSCKGNPEEVINYFEGIKTEFGKKVKLNYAKGCRVDSFKIAGKELISKAVKKAQESEIVVMVLGEEYWMSGEGGGTASLHLPGLQEELLTKVAKTGKPIVTVINAGRPYILTKIEKYSDAIIYAWMPGTTGGTALAEILSGKFNPQGKLPVTFPYHEGQVPIYYNYRKTSHGFVSEVPANRYSTTYRDVQNEPLYPFGFGLSYTTYDYNNLEVSKTSMTENDSIKISIDIHNNGKVKGTEIVQLYIRDKFCSITRPIKELKDFTLLELKSNESKKAIFTITSEKLAFISEGKEYNKTLETGEFDILIGSSSSDIKAKTTITLK